MSRSISGIARKYLQFCLVGGSGLVVDMAMLWTLHSQFGWSVPVAKLVAAEIALLNNFIWNEYWTFKEVVNSRGTRWARLLRFHAVCLVGIGIALGILLILNERLGWSVGLANGAAIVLSSMWNFLLSWVWGWRDSSRSTAQDGLPRTETG